MVDAERPPLSVAELSARLAAKEQEVEDVKQSSHAALEDVQRQVVEAFTRLDELRGLLKEREVTLQESHAPSWDDDGGFSNRGDDNPAAGARGEQGGPRQPCSDHARLAGAHGTPDDVISSHSDASPDRSPLKTGSRAIEGAGLSTKSSASLQVRSPLTEGPGSIRSRNLRHRCNSSSGNWSNGRLGWRKAGAGGRRRKKKPALRRRSQRRR